MDKANIPRTWLMTDERMGDQLFDAIDRLPPFSGVVFRHHLLARAERMRLGEEVVRACRRAGHFIAVSRDGFMAQALGADLLHNPRIGYAGGPCSYSVHDFISAGRVNQGNGSLAFLSPIFPTRSHPDRKPLSRDEVRFLLEVMECPVIALGGMDAQRFASVEDLGFHGWAGIDAWLRT